MAGWREMILLRHRRMVGRLFAPAHEAASPASGASRFRAYRVTTMLLSRWISLLLAQNGNPGMSALAPLLEAKRS